MKHLILFTLLLSFYLTGFAQKTKDKGDKFYKEYSYEESISKYENLKDKNIDINRKLAISYFNINNFEKSMEYWKAVAEDSESVPEDLYNYASILKINKKYEEAQKWMEKFYNLNKTDSRAKKWMLDSDLYKRLLKDKGIFIVENLDINSSQQDFGTSYFKDKVVFASSREQSPKIVKRVWNWNNLPYLDIYIGELDSSKHITNVSRFRKRVNKRFHDGPAAFNKAGDFMVFTSSDYDGRSQEDIVKLKLFSKKLENGNWTKPEPFSFNSSEYSVGHASLTENADTMYFVSDMPGGFGGTDLYFITRKQDGTWTKPENMGATVNTEGNEMFPFIHPSGLLFFASNGLPGLGGLDVFYSTVKNGKIGKPENLGVPINSSYDDFAMIMDDEQKSGFFSSNRISGHGDDDIYLFKLIKPLKKNIYITGKAYDGSGNLMSNVLVSLLNDKGDTIATVVTNDDASYMFAVEPESRYKLNGTKADYNEDNKDVATKADEENINVDLHLNAIPKNSILLIVTDAQTNEPLSADVKVTDLVNKTQDSFLTSAEGQYVLDISDKNINDKLNYDFALTKTGYMPEDYTLDKVLEEEGQLKVHIKMNKSMELPVIYFDFDKSNIRKDAVDKLNKVVQIMNKYPKMVVELSSHTDCRGSYKYNIKLSNRRAKSSAKYIRKRLKNNPERIYGKGYGESRLVNDCECEGDKKSSCSEQEHQLNRRTEFVIIKY